MKLGIIACGAIVRELIAIANLEGWDFALTAVPAQLHNAPEAIPAAVQAKLTAVQQALLAAHQQAQAAAAAAPQPEA